MLISKIDNFYKKISDMLLNVIPSYQIFKYNKNELSIVVPDSSLISSLKILKQHVNFQFNMLTCISGVDLLTSVYRFSVVYELLSITYNFRFRVKVYTNETNPIPSAVSIYPCANWWEREVWDMFGIFFRNNKDLRRILTDYGFEGHPLRKDFPLSGYSELRYDLIGRRIITESINLTQEQRASVHEAQW